MVWGSFFSLLLDAGIRGLRFPLAVLPGNSRCGIFVVWGSFYPWFGVPIRVYDLNCHDFLATVVLGSCIRGFGFLFASVTVV